MNTYIKNILPRIREFSASLDRIEFFVEVPWVLIDSNSKWHKYIFRRNGDLIMSKDGQAIIGKWEYLSTSRCLLINRIEDQILLNQNFIDPALMILKKDGSIDENIILANELLIPDLDIEKYIRNLFLQRNNIVLVPLKNGSFIEKHNFGYDNRNVSREGLPVPDGEYELRDVGKKYLIFDSQIKKVITKVIYKTKKGIIAINQEEFMSPKNGDTVFLNNEPAPDGKYRLGFMNSIFVQNGKIIIKQ